VLLCLNEGEGDVRAYGTCVGGGVHLCLQEEDHLGRLRRVWDDNIKMDLKGLGLERVEWIRLTE
jgi:hypothetical protein